MLVILSMLFVAILCNLMAVATGLLAVGDARNWNYTFTDLMSGKKLPLIYGWVIGSTAFSLVHFTALVTSSPLIGVEFQSSFWLVMHALIGIFFTLAHLFVDMIFEDRELAGSILGVELS